MIRGVSLRVRIRRMRVAIACAGVLAAAFGSVQAAGASGSPVLGWAHAFPNGTGFGQVTPRHVFLGGDPTGDVTGLRWRSWGAGKTLGFGTGWCPGRSVADGYYCSVSLHAYNLGRCHGRRAYRTLTFYFKPGPQRRWMFGSRWNTCTGSPS